VPLDGLPRRPIPPVAPVFDHLTAEQAAGRACIVAPCRASFGERCPAAVVVGVAKGTGQKVRACRSGCAQLVGWTPRSGWIQPAR
jgi:hypothetical protein